MIPKKHIILIILIGIFLPIVTEYTSDLVRVYNSYKTILWNDIKVGYFNNYFSPEDRGNELRITSKFDANIFSLRKTDKMADINSAVNCLCGGGFTILTNESTLFNDEKAVKIVAKNEEDNIYSELFFLEERKVVISYWGDAPINNIYQMLFRTVELL